PASHVTALAAAYQRGTGASPPPSELVPYPGWVFVPAHPDQPTIAISAHAQAAVAAGRRIPLQLDVRPVHHVRRSDASGHDHLDRDAVLREVLTPLVEDHGCAGVVCNTVDDAQRTYEMVREWAGSRAEVRLLHSRFPSQQREEITEEIVAALGKDGAKRPERMIMVATQVIEQSLDLDFDLVISDLAPFAQLIQRAGRCYRHSHTRPRWAKGPRLVVLDPQHEGCHAKPLHWGDVYHPYLLRATHLRLAGVGKVQIPEDVQGHMEAIYSPTGISDPRLADDYVDYQVEAMVGRQVADLWVVPDPQNVGDLAALSQGEITEGRAATRLGAESVRVLCCYVDQDGGQWLDPERTRPLQKSGSGPGERFDADEIRSILNLTIPVRESLLRGYQPGIELPVRWEKIPWLGELRALWFHLGPEGPRPIEIAGRATRLDHELGLVARRWP
uniref:CRISPR-associated helicase Cas3' n=1 Tax=Rhizomonospora bruguierae TaxID=1581705 RepID=UPI001BD0C614